MLTAWSADAHSCFGNSRSLNRSENESMVEKQTFIVFRSQGTVAATTDLLITFRGCGDNDMISTVHMLSRRLSLGLLGTRRSVFSFREGAVPLFVYLPNNRNALVSRYIKTWQIVDNRRANIVISYEQSCCRFGYEGRQCFRKGSNTSSKKEGGCTSGPTFLILSFTLCELWALLNRIHNKIAVASRLYESSTDRILGVAG